MAAAWNSCVRLSCLEHGMTVHTNFDLVSGPLIIWLNHRNGSIDILVYKQQPCRIVNRFISDVKQ